MNKEITNKEILDQIKVLIKSINERFESVNERFDRAEKSTAERFESVNERFDRAEKSTAEQTEKLAQITADGFERMDKKIDNFRDELKQEIKQKTEGLARRDDDFALNKAGKDEHYELKQHVEEIDHRVVKLETATA